MTEPKAWLAGFVYRGRAPWETAASAYHVEIGEYVEVAGRDPVPIGTKVLTPEEAKTAGHSLPKVLSAINADVMYHNDALAKEIEDRNAAHSAECAEMRIRIDEKHAECMLLQQSLEREMNKNASLNATVADVLNKYAELRKNYGLQAD